MKTGNFITDYIKDNDVYFYHSPLSLTNPKRVTIAGVVKDIDGQKVLQVGASICASDDNFCKADGRARATSRAIGSKTRDFLNITSTNGKDIRTAMANFSKTLIYFKYKNPVLNGNLK
jgi:hypothetical protein